MKALWSMEKPEFRGRFFSFSAVRAEPRPVQKPYPEIVFGGKSKHAFSRTARLGNGWFGYALDLDATAQCAAGLRDAFKACGRSFDELEVSITPKGELDRDLALRYAELGVRRLIISPRARSVDDVLHAISQAERTLIAKVSS
jgi:alkanesulfonate monooxygenase SsuD/methylene tetrahydromethanopterin reductase-like flavin-dependent oxidoreductase (luciferase family)